MFSSARILANQDVSYLNDILLNNGLLKVVPANILAEIPQQHLTLFGHKHGFYCFPTVELAEWLKIPGLENTIEIGAGHGALARYLGIPATDSKLMQNPEVALLYRLMGQPVTTYPDDVIKLDAVEAIKKYKPKTVIGCWVTHKYIEEEAAREGNMYGVDEQWVLKNVDRYIIIGNEKVHGQKKILELSHKTYKFPWLYSRSVEPTKNIIYVWEKVSI